MTDKKVVEVPENILSLLWGHLSRKDSECFYRGFLSLIEYQYPDSQLSRFYDEHSLDSDFIAKLTQFILFLMNSGSSALPSSEPVQDEGTRHFSLSNDELRILKKALTFQISSLERQGIKKDFSMHISSLYSLFDDLDKV